VDLKNRISALSGLGRYLNHIHPDDLEELIHATHAHNAWFDEESVLAAIEGIKVLLEESNMSSFVAQYDLKVPLDKKIGIVMAGNIPAVGFHDLLMVLLSGCEAYIKPSQQDEVLLKFLVNHLLEIESEFKIYFVEQLVLNDLDAVIATGSNNTARYFETYFSKLPNVIRKSRTSVAVLSGDESKEEIEALGKDIFRYYGLGCRNVTKVYVPEGYDFVFMLDSLQSYSRVIYQHKYDNNYNYHKSVYLINGREHLDTGFLMVTEDDGLHSPLSVLFYETYKTLGEVKKKVLDQKEFLQCVASNIKSIKGSVLLGQTQSPKISDYADGVDIIDFLQKM